MADQATPLTLPVWKKLLYTALVFVPALLVIEVVLRLCGYGPAPQAPAARPLPGIDPLEYYAVCDRRLGFRNRPNGTFRNPRIAGNPLSTTDEFGYRNGFAWPGDGKSPIVLFIGDSITFCAEVNDDETGSSEVAKLLDKHFDVRVLNAGVQGYSILQSKRMLLECLQRFPEIVLTVYTHCGNDAAESMVPNLRLPAKAPVMMRSTETGEFQEVEVSDPVVPWGRNIFPWRPPSPPPAEVPTTIQKVSLGIEDWSATWHLVVETGRDFRAEYPPPREFPRDNEITSPEDHGYWNGWAMRNGGDRVIQRLLAEMNEICRSRGVVFLATDYLTGLDGYRSDRFAKLCDGAGVRFVCIDGQFANASTAHVARWVNGEYDAHYSAVGTKAYAAGLAPALDRILRGRIPPPAAEKKPAGGG